MGVMGPGKEEGRERGGWGAGRRGRIRRGGERG